MQMPADGLAAYAPKLPVKLRGLPLPVLDFSDKGFFKCGRADAFTNRPGWGEAFHDLLEKGIDSAFSRCYDTQVKRQ